MLKKIPEGWQQYWISNGGKERDGGAGWLINVSPIRSAGYGENSIGRVTAAGRKCA
jgi:hypothetical protein